MTVTEQQQQGALGEKQQGILDLIDSFHAIEKSLNDKITKGEGSASEHLESLAKLRASRINTLNYLKEIYRDEQSALIGNARVLTDQKMTNELLSNQITEAEKELNILKDNRLNKKRLVQLGDYEYDRYRSHKNILKIIVYGTLAVFLILMAMTNIPFFPPAAGVFGIFLIMCIVIYTIFGRIYNNFRRRGHNWNKFNYSRYSKNQPVQTSSTDDDDSSSTDDETTCKNLGWSAPAADVTLSIDDGEGFSGMINTETLSRNVEPSNSKDYEKYPTLF